MRVEEGVCLCLFQRGCVYYLMMFSDYLMMFSDYLMMFSDYLMMFSDYMMMFSDYMMMFSDYLMMFTQTDKHAAIQIHTYRQPISYH